ncbi:retrotransposon ORF1 [Tanacetum coccineum]
MAKMKGQMLKEKKDPVAFIFPIRLEGRINENALTDTGSDTNTMPYRIYEQLGRDDIIKEDRNITMINYTEAEVIGRLVNVLCQVGFTTLSAKFLILEIPIDRDAPIVVGHGFLDTIGGNIDIPNRIFTTFDGHTRQTFRAAKSEKIRIAESDSDDEEDYVIKRNDMGTPIHNSRPIGYQNNTNPAENMTLSTLKSKPDYKLCYSNPELATGHWKTEIRLTDPYENIYMQAFVTKPTKKKLSKYHKLSDIMSPNWLQVHTIMRPGQPMPNALEMLKPSKKHYFRMFTTNSWNREVVVEKQSLVITLELYREFYATYKFDEVCANDELQSKKIISFRLGGHAHSLTLLEFARRLGLYHAEELNEEGFDAYFQGGLRSDENFNAREYWERISIDRDLYLSRSSITSVRFLILRVLHKMITYGLCQRTTRYEKIQRNDLWLKGAGSQKDSQICCGQFISKIARKSKVLTKETIRSLSTPVYCRDLDRTTLRELIKSEDRLIPEIPVDDVPIVAT